MNSGSARSLRALVFFFLLKGWRILGSDLKKNKSKTRIPGLYLTHCEDKSLMNKVR